MVSVTDQLLALCGVLLALVLWRWLWFTSERKRLIKSGRFDDDRFERMNFDEDEQEFSGRVIRRLRSRVVEGRVEISWQFNPEYVHRGFILTGKCRRNDGGWEPLAFEPYEDSGSWHECFNYGESRSYLFTVKKTYRFFFGLFRDDQVEVVYDQISFSVRKGKYLKEKKELMHDRKELLLETKEYAKVVAELRLMAREHGEQRGTLRSGDPKSAKLRQAFAKQSAMTDALEQLMREIEARADWSPERKQREIEKLQQMAEEAALED